ncbi:MAG: acyl-ACP--UDP-N-acetylglucosamine O-acyltransferase [Planctomycetota bacterium]|jgi:UDP-N-acetylglucosamine acyltransferase
MAIHPTAIIDPQAQIDSSVEIGPYAIIEGPAKIGANTKVRGHCFINGWTEIGQNCDLHPFAVIGNYPQDFHYEGERSYCKIGNNVVIREGTTVHRGTQPESSTIVGDECFLMAYCHVGHNCILGKGVKIYNLAILSGHVEIGDYVIVSGYAGVHQFVRIGTLAFLAGKARVTMDVPPFFTCYGNSTIVQHNVIGMKRAGYDNDALQEIRNAYRTLYRSGMTFGKAVEQLSKTVKTGAGKKLVEFISAESKQGYCAGGVHTRNRVGKADTAEVE